MTVAFRHGDPRYPFFWETTEQPAARWHAAGDGPVQYLADTPDGAWAELLRHEEITEAGDLAGISRRLWAVEFDEAAEVVRPVDVPDYVARGGLDSYPACQAAAASLRNAGATCLRAPSAALVAGGARGQCSQNGGLREAPDRDGVVWVLIGSRKTARGWAAVDAGGPTEGVLSLVTHLGTVPAPQRRGDADHRHVTEPADRRPGYRPRH